jgi:hypothetical protein
MDFVGTLGYVMSELEDGKKLSEVVRTAKSLGYTEPGLNNIILIFLHYNIHVHRFLVVSFLKMELK